MAFYGNDVGIVPLTEAAWISQGFKPGKHYGIDIGWHAVANCDIIAWQEGTVVGKGYYSDTGYWVALQHNYSNNKYRWSVYIHMKDPACVNVSQKVAFAQKIGIRGNTGRSNGTHLHLYLTKEMSAKQSFSFTALKANAIDPTPYLYYDKKYNYLYIATNYWKKPLPAPIDEVVKPVEKDISKNQVICHTDNLRVRTAPSTSADRIGHIEKDKYYDYFEIKEADNFKWYKLKENQWVAGIEELEVLPKVEIVNPVEKDENKDQLICSVDNLRVRTDASLKGSVLGFLQKDKYYNYYESKNADGYDWYRIAENQWVAKIEELKILPKEIYYIVQNGDTLESIAISCGISLEELTNLNPQLIEDGDRLRVK